MNLIISSLNWTIRQYGDSLDTSIMPLIDGGDRSVGIGITLNSRQFVQFSNFQITNYEAGRYAWGASNLMVDNIVVHSTGDIDADYN